MSSAKRVARNTSLLTIGQIISYGEGAIYAILVARYLGAAGLGVLNFGLALTAVFGILATFGLTTLATREVAKDRGLARKYVANLIPMEVLLGLAAIGLIVALVNSVGYSQQTICVVYILSVGMIVSALSSLFLAIFQAFEQLEFQAAVSVIISVVPLCGVVIAILLHLSVVAFALVWLFGKIVHDKILREYPQDDGGWFFEVPGKTGTPGNSNGGRNCEQGGAGSGVAGGGTNSSGLILSPNCFFRS